MPTSHDAVAAFPISAAASQTSARNLAVKRMAYVLADADDSRDLVCLDPVTGQAVIDLVQLGRLFHYDSTDTVTAHDGTSVLVSYEGRRYKLASNADVLVYSVLSNTLPTPPVSPSIGDAYLVAAAGTGAWSGWDNRIAIYTSRGWESIVAATGRLVYVSAGTNADTYYRKKANGSWAAGPGAQTIAALSVPLSAAINFGKRLIVENQTTTAPPASPSIGDAYVVGAGATGAWSGHDTKIAICEVGTSFTIYTHGVGWTIYDKALGNDYRWTGSAWAVARGAAVAFAKQVTTSGSQSSSNGSAYSVSDTVPPNTSTPYLKDDATIAIAGGNTSNFLKFEYSFIGGAGTVAVALFRGTAVPVYETDAIAWAEVGDGTTGHLKTVMFVVPVPDLAVHTYQMRLNVPGSGTAPATAITRRVFTAEEFVVS